MANYPPPQLPALGLLRRQMDTTPYTPKHINQKALTRARCRELGVSGRRRRMLRQAFKHADLGRANAVDLRRLARYPWTAEEIFNRGDVLEILRKFA